MIIFRTWFEAIRPKTLTAGTMPVVMASALAYSQGTFHWLPALITFFCAALIQITSNFVNEIYDFRKGADTSERLGPRRAVAAGIISERQMIRASIITTSLAFILGMYLVTIAGLPIFLTGVLCLFFAWIYTGGPFPLAYRGLGDVFAFICFGNIAVCGSYYIQTLELSWSAFFLSMIPAAFSANILGVNNIRDIATDALAGKRTFAVRFGVVNARKLYYAMMLLAFAIPFLLFFQQHSFWLFLPFLALPKAFHLSRELSVKEGRSLNQVLAGTAALLGIYGILISLALCLKVWI